eukprot:CAMPEP_0182832988 /NCGR_PEP_ID=MMETSP0006_2-20121128/20029_1 /TAXON_ID=97485 /ORGANISM="Prymnesium parvum, Strain Texoma1" /LENGTH=54 /DNA_ID=CAMNT_0024960913 /DNA_START=81 /DNA_END=241 /DNA_ORIENTATION=-
MAPDAAQQAQRRPQKILEELQATAPQHVAVSSTGAREDGSRGGDGGGGGSITEL